MNPDLSKWLTALGETGIGWVTVNRLRAVLPLLFMQSDKAAELFRKAKGRIAEIKAFENVIANEVEVRNSTRRALIERITSATPDERLDIEQKLEWLDGVTRQLNISLKSISYQTSETTPSNHPEEKKDIQDHWLDRFNDLARKRNEPWRVELLARALGKEAANPGTVSARALWLIGTLEEALFKEFSELLDICVWMWPNVKPFIPSSRIEATERLIGRKYGKGALDMTVGQLIYNLSDIGVIAEPSSSQRTIHPGTEFLVYYGNDGYIVNVNVTLVIKGVLFTPLGESLASFYDPKWNNNGAMILRDWIASIEPKVTHQKEQKPARSQTKT